MDIENPNIQVHRIKPGGFKEIRKQILLRTLPVMVLSMTAGVVMSSINSKSSTNGLQFFLFLIPFLILIGGTGIYRALKRQKALWDSYTLSFAGNVVIREQLNTPVIMIPFNEITAITKLKIGTICIRGKKPADLIMVPAQVENYEQLESTLQQVMPVTIKTSATPAAKFGWLIGLLSLGLMFTVYTVSNKMVVAISGTALVALMCWSIIKTQRNKNIDSKTKRSMWWVIIVLLSVILIMITKLTAGK
jgi:hypothetical protein